MSMHLRASARPPTVLRALRVTAIRLSGRPETAALAEETQALRARLSAAVDAHDALLDASAAATAEIRYRDEVEDDAIRAVARDLRVLVAGDLGDPRWGRLFRVAPSAAIAPSAGPEQAAVAAYVIEKLRSDPDYAPLQHHLPVLVDARAGVAAAEAARDALRQGLYAAAVARDEALAVAIRHYGRLRPRLELLFDSAAVVRSFFPDARSGGSGGAED